MMKALRLHICHLDRTPWEISAGFRRLLLARGHQADKYTVYMASKNLRNISYTSG